MVPVWQFGLTGILAVALVTDLQSRKIYNWLTFPAMIAGLVLSVAFGGLGGLQSAGIGFVVATFLFIIGFLMNIGGSAGMGAGDVKLMAAIGLWLGWPTTLSAVVYITFIGGIISILTALANGTLVKLFQNVLWFTKLALTPGANASVALTDSAAPPLPYGVSIVLGTLVAFFFPDVKVVIDSLLGR